MNNSLRKCILYCLQSNESINLPHNKSITIGRNLTTGIKDPSLSRVQVTLIPNIQTCTVNVIPLGINPSGVNGFVLNRNKQYTLRNKDILELLLNKYFYEIKFNPEPDESCALESNKRKFDETVESNATKQQKIDLINYSISGWKEIDDKKLYIFTANNVQNRNKIAAYDLDGTIITTKSGARFPENYNDWKFLYSEVPKKLLEMHKNGYKVVIFTNQAGVSTGRVKINEFQKKIENIANDLKVPFQAFISTGKGVYRKPAPGMWDALITRSNNNVNIDFSQSFYCGDAAGREKNWAPKKKKDHSVCDRLFALNIGLSFQTPEEHFLGAKIMKGIMPEFDPRNLKILPLLIPENTQLVTSNQEVIIFVGAPGSGKSFICNNHLVPKNYVYVNRDNLGSWQKCIATLETALQKKQSVVIDNTNPDKESRKRYVDVAKKYNVSCRCFVMNTSINQAKHNNLFREITDRNHKIITDIIINSYKKKFQEPTLGEGFNEIVNVNCVPEFSDTKYERLYHMFLLEK